MGLLFGGAGVAVKQCILNIASVIIWQLGSGFSIQPSGGSCCTEHHQSEKALH